MQQPVSPRRAAQLFALALLLSSAAIGSARSRPPAPHHGAPAAAPAAEAGPGGFVPSGSAIHLSDYPAMTFGEGKPWVAYEDLLAGKLVVSAFDPASASWQQQGAPLADVSSVRQERASIAFAGPGKPTPWVAFVEKSGASARVVAARFSSGVWQRVGGALNRNPASDVALPSLASDAPNGTPVPWAAWNETEGGRLRVNVGQLVGDAWQLAGPSIGFNPARSAVLPSLALAGETPWVTWFEQGLSQPERAFVARGLADASAPGGYRWDVIGRQSNCANDEAACALNLQPAGDAEGARVAAGALPGEAIPSPWVVFAERDPDGVRQVYVRRLDGDRFRQVGGSLNVDPTQTAGLAQIAFVRGVPHVVWLEGSAGSQRLYVRHLADTRPGQERWDLDGSAAPVGADAISTDVDSFPMISSGGTTPYVAFHGGGGANGTNVAYRAPAGPAWGRNYPPFIRIISGTRNLAARALPDTAHDEQLLQAGAALGKAADADPAIITTSCDHANGWDSISEIQMRLADAQGAVFLGRYVAAENKVYLEDPDHPGVFLGGFTPGAQQNIETRFAALDVGTLRVTSHGAGSAALDIAWPISFRQAAYGRVYTQAINIVYRADAAGRAATQTSFFSVGQAQVGDRQYLPLVVR